MTEVKVNNMTQGHHQRLLSFYRKAFLTPQLLCLNCALNSWQGPYKGCTNQRRQDCALFVSDMLATLDRRCPQAGPQAARRRNQQISG